MSFKEEYTRESISINDVSFKIKKIPAIKSSILFIDLVGKFKSIDAGIFESTSKDLSENGKTIALAVKSALSVLDPEYLEKLMPKFFEYITFSIDGMDGVKDVKLSDAGKLLDYKIDAFDVLELLFRGICVNFLESGLARLSKLKHLT